MNYFKYTRELLPTMLLSTLMLSTLIGCSTKEEIAETPPNILWIYLEDTAPITGCYGSELVSTPNIDKLAKDGVLFTNAFMPAPVCSASRSSIITGVMSTSIGAHNHHSSRTELSANYLPDYLKTVPEVFRAAEYYTFNNGKDDYNFTYDRQDLYPQDYQVHPLYGKGGDRIPLSELKNNQPFFGQIQLYGGKEIFSSSFKDRVKSPVDRSKIELPPYLPNHPAIIEEYANHLDAIQITDERVGKIVEELRVSGVLKNTVLFFFSDHGMRLTRHKQFLYDGGIRVPLIIADFRDGHKDDAGSVNSDLVSGLDLGTTSLALAGIEIPEYMQGRDFFDKSVDEREYVISTRDRCDFTIDRIRSVRSKEYKYIRNFMTDRPYTQPTYMDADGVEFVGVMKQLYAENKLDSIQARFLSDVRPAEELYNIKDDPFEINNLAEDSNYSAVLAQYATVLDNWIIETKDMGEQPENEENLKLMLGIWGKSAVNPEYDLLREKYKGLGGSLLHLKNQGFKKVTTKKAIK